VRTPNNSLLKGDRDSKKGIQEESTSGGIQAQMVVIGVKYCLLDPPLLMFVRLLSALITNVL
jgi:hypothetical protein